MRIKKLEKLQNLLDSDLIWRKKELIDVKFLIHESDNPMLSRVGMALLSAHFEGFIKQSANYYVVYVASQNKELSVLTNNFTAIFLNNKFDNIVKSNKITMKHKFIDDFLELYNDENKKFKVNYSIDRPIIKTESNPTSKVLKEIVCSIGLDYSLYEVKSKYIDSDLLKNRNAIVHGERIQIDKDDFDKTLSNIIQIMEMFNDQIIDAAIQEIYLKK